MRISDWSSDVCSSDLRIDDTHDLIRDGVAHLRYLPAFGFGFGLAGSRPVMAALARHWKAAAVVAIGCYTTLAGLLIAYPDLSFTSAARVLADRFARTGVGRPPSAAVNGDRKSGRLGKRVYDRIEMGGRSKDKK